MANQIYIEPEDFARKFEGHWKHLGNVSNEALRETSKQFAEIVGKHLQNPELKEWTILQSLTGTGKTQMTMFYCVLLSKLSDENHPGVLIVTKLQTEVDEKVGQINELGKGKTAQGYHANMDEFVDLKDLKKWPVVVICHERFRRCLDEYQVNPYTERWNHFNSYRDKTRGLIIIDESLDILEESKVIIQQIFEIKSKITEEIRERFPNPIALIDQMTVNLERRRKKTLRVELPKEEVTPAEWERFTRVLLKEGRDMDQINSDEDKRNEFNKTLRSIYQIWSLYQLYQPKGYEHSISAGRTLIPDNAKGAVVLDATASCNPIYNSDKFNVLPAPGGARRYNKVTSYISMGHRTGKVSMTKNKRECLEQLMDFLTKNMLPKSHVLVVTHKDLHLLLEGVIKNKTYKPKDFDLSVTHWGKHAGVNDWKDCDTVVLYGLPWRNLTTMQHLALATYKKEKIGQGCKEGNRDYLLFSNKDLEIFNMLCVSGDVIQAVNRTRARRVIDKAGNCPHLNVYLILPGGQKAKTILQEIKKAMPGIRVQEFDFGGLKIKRGAKRKYEDRLITRMGGLEPGPHMLSEILGEIGVAKATRTRMRQQLEDPKTELGRAAIESGIHVKSKKRKGGKIPFLVKREMTTQAGEGYAENA